LVIHKYLTDLLFLFTLRAMWSQRDADIKAECLVPD